MSLRLWVRPRNHFELTALDMIPYPPATDSHPCDPPSGSSERASHLRHLRRWRRVLHFSQPWGFGLILLAPLLLACSAWHDAPWALVGLVMLGFPLARWIFGAVRPGAAPPWSVGQVRLLEGWPLVYSALLPMTLAVLLWRLQHSDDHALQSAGWLLSLWLVLIFGTCVAHALLHDSRYERRILGHALAGLCGYPFLGVEHARHHRISGSTEAAEAARTDESLWGYAWRRQTHVLRLALGRQGAVWTSPRLRGPMLTALTATWLAAAAFTIFGGVQGLAVYALACVLVAFGVQAVTYLQHWGLGDDAFSQVARDLAWEDDCRFQAWVTLNLSLHQSHHHESARPYYRIGLQRQAPRPPAGYLVLLAAALVPAVWRSLMLPAVRQWQRQPHRQPSAGHRLVCWNLYRAGTG